MDYNATMENEIELTAEQRERACNTEQEHHTLSVRYSEEWNLAHVVLTDEIAQIAFKAGGKIHFFTREDFEKFPVRFPTQESIDRIMHCIEVQQRDGRSVFKSFNN